MVMSISCFRLLKNTRL